MVLAEIADKMATIPQMWGIMIVFSALISIPCFIHKRVAFIMLAIGAFFSIVLAYASYQDAFTEPYFSEAVQNELGTIWIANSFASSLCPFVFTGFILLWHVKKNK